MKKYIYISLAFLALTFYGNIVFGADYPEVACSQFGASANSCNQCFNGGVKYQGIGEINLSDYFDNRNVADTQVIYKDNFGNVAFDTLQSGTTWYHSTDMFKFPDALVWQTAQSGRNYHAFVPGSYTKILESRPGTGIRLENVSNGSRSLPGFRISYTNNYQTFKNGALDPTVNSHKECAFYYPAWCGDGVLDSNRGEQCDAGAQNGQPNSGCSATCTTATNNLCVAGSVTGPQSSAISATTAGLCQIGSVGGFTSNVVGSTTNYSWTCNGVNGGNCSASYNSASASCVAGSVTGPQSNSISSATPGLCQTGPVGGFNATTAGSTTNYSWTCNSLSGGNCSASYTTGGPLVPACNNLVISAGTKALNDLVAGDIVSFTGEASNVGSSPVYRLVIRNTTASTEVTLTSANGIFTYTIPTTASYTATLYIDISPALTVGGEFGCARGLGGGGSSSSQYYACTSTTPCQTYATQAQCELLVGPGKCYLTELQCNANAVANGCGSTPPGGSQYYSCTASNACQTNSTQASCEALYGAGRCYATEASCLSAAPAQCPGTSGGGNRCGDGIVQRPNDAGVDEQCDGAIGCGSDCKMSGTITNPGETGPAKITITNPGSGGSAINISLFKVIVGNNVSVFGKYESINLTSLLSPTQGIYREDTPICIKNTNPLIIGGNLCYRADVKLGIVHRKKSDGTYEILNYGNTFPLFDGSVIANKFFGSTDSFMASNSLYKNTPTTGVLSATPSFYASVNFLEDPISVRVVKNIVSNVAGGNAYIYNPVGFSIDSAVAGFINKLNNGNFITSSSNSSLLSTKENLSSLTSMTSNDGLNLKIGQKSLNDETNISNTRFGVSGSSYVELISILDDFNKTSIDNLGDNTKVRVLKNGSMNIQSYPQPIMLKGVKTIIIEKGDLEINNDIYYDSAEKNASWAFIVKNGNIRISKDVRHIAGVFLAMNINGEAGKGILESIDGETANQLIVDGSLYGNSENLSKDRTYVRGTEGSTALATGIIINYSNRSLKNPPSMLTYFIEQYTQKRVAK